MTANGVQTTYDTITNQVVRRRASTTHPFQDPALHGGWMPQLEETEADPVPYPGDGRQGRVL